MDARLIGPRQFGYGGTKALPRRSVLATPSFADRVTARPPVAIMHLRIQLGVIGARQAFLKEWLTQNQASGAQNP